MAKRPLNRDQIRALAVLKLWNGGGQGLDFEIFRQRVEGGADYDIGDLRNLLRKDEAPDLATMIRRAVEGFQFLGAMTELERVVAADQATQSRKEAADLMTLIIGRGP